MCTSTFFCYAISFLDAYFHGHVSSPLLTCVCALVMQITFHYVLCHFTLCVMDTRPMLCSPCREKRRLKE